MFLRIAKFVIKNIKMTTAAIRNKLYDYIRVAEEKKLHAIYNLLENEIEQTNQWWEDAALTNELENRYATLESGEDKGFTMSQLAASFDNLREKRYGK